MEDRRKRAGSVLVAIFLGGLSVAASPANGAQCSGDIDHDGGVTVADAVQVVRQAIYGCASSRTRTPTPTSSPRSTATARPTATGTPQESCPIDFSMDNTAPGSLACGYVGYFNTSCGDMMTVGFISDRELLLVFAVDPDVTFVGQVSGARSADMVGWYAGGDVEGLTLLSGQIGLSSGGNFLAIAPTRAPFTIDGCPFVKYGGAYWISFFAGAAAIKDTGSMTRDPSETLQRLRSTLNAAPTVDLRP